MVRNLRATMHVVVEADCHVRVAVAAVYTVHVDVRVVYLMHRRQQDYIKLPRWRKVVASNKVLTVMFLLRTLSQELNLQTCSLSMCVIPGYVRVLCVCVRCA